jgi:hypothetical protein
MGIDVNRAIATAFAIGSALGAFGGVMTVLYYGQISFPMGFLAGLKSFTAAVLGGIGNIPGACSGVHHLDRGELPGYPAPPNSSGGQVAKYEIPSRFEPTHTYINAFCYAMLGC